MMRLVVAAIPTIVNRCAMNTLRIILYIIIVICATTIIFAHINSQLLRICLYITLGISIGIEIKSLDRRKNE